MTPPLFSVIVAMYEQAHYLPQLLRAFEEQEFRDFELLLCDDGSTDRTGALAKRAASENEHIFYHRSEHNTGSYAKTMNMGVRAATGRFLLFISGDSFPETDYLSTLREWVADDRIVCGIRIQIDEVAGKTEGVDIDARIKKAQIPPGPAILASEPWGLMTGNGLCVPAAALAEEGLWDERFVGYGGEDNELIARLYYKGYVCYSVPDLRLYHHWHKAKDAEPDTLARTSALITRYGR
jgi:GT2 family glycosyltransferase